MGMNKCFIENISITHTIILFINHYYIDGQIHNFFAGRVC